MRNKLQELGKLIGEVEKASSVNFMKFLLQKFTGRFLTNKKDFIKLYNTVVEKCAYFGINSSKAILSASELDNYEYEKNATEFQLFNGYSEFYFINNERIRIGSNIERIRKENGLSQNDLAIRTGLKQPNIARIEKGKYSTGIDIFSNIALVLGVDKSELMK